MFKDVLTLWNRYSDTLDKDSQQWSRSGEVEERLVQLDLTLGYLKRALTAVSKDSSSWAAWARVVLFTETFYLVAWRLRVVLRSKGALAWPGLGMLPRDDAITFVRNRRIKSELHTNCDQAHVRLPCRLPHLSQVSTPIRYIQERGIVRSSELFRGECLLFRQVSV
jgi:hypothetical protein